MAVHEFKSAKNQGEYFVVPVINHKTGHIVCTSNDNPLPSLTVRYIEVLRKTPNVNERNEALVFVTYGGTNMGSNLVRSQL